MTKAVFVFTSYANSYKVHVQNLEKLSVEQIQKIEAFVQRRKGMFDFTNYTFEIQKRVDFFEFEKLITSVFETAICINEPKLAIQEARVSFGQYKGMFYSELPDSYLLWLKTNYMGKDKSTIEAELKKRKL